jgi:hypothetical protein
MLRSAAYKLTLFLEKADKIQTEQKKSVTLLTDLDNMRRTHGRSREKEIHQ